MAESSRTIACLSSFLRGELCATEIYRYTLDHVTRPKWRLALEDAMQSHARRAVLLKRRIDALGGIPSRSSGTWGIFAKALAIGADMLGPVVAIATLKLGETHGRLSYLRKLPRLDRVTRTFVEAQLLPAQELTHEWITDLKRVSSLEYALDR